MIVALCASRGLRPQVLFLPTSLVAYAALATHQWLDVGPFAASPDPYELPAQARPLCPTCQAFHDALWNARVIYALLQKNVHCTKHAACTCCVCGSLPFSPVKQTCLYL